jgi:hypothetical protein
MTALKWTRVRLQLRASRRGLGAVVLPALLFGESLAGQSTGQQETRAERERTCIAKQAEVRARPYRRASEGFNAMVHYCGSASAMALGPLWDRPPTDSLDLARLVRASRQVLDERILQAVMRVVADAAQPRQIRLAGIEVLYTYGSYACGNTRLVATIGFGQPRGNSPLRPDIPRVINSAGALSLSHIVGVEPIAGDAGARMAAQMRELAERPGEDSYLVSVYWELIYLFEFRPDASGKLVRVCESG